MQRLFLALWVMLAVALPAVAFGQAAAQVAP